jgi:hypothetical protein
MVLEGLARFQIRNHVRWYSARVPQKATKFSQSVSLTYEQAQSIRVLVQSPLRWSPPALTRARK